MSDKKIIGYIIVLFLFIHHQCCWAHFKISPSKIELLPHQKIVTVSVTNQSELKRYIQVEALTWEQNDNKDNEEITNELIIFPKILKLKVGQTKFIQIKPRSGPLENLEKSYRILLKEIPNSENKVKNGINILINFKIPVYIKPLHRTPITLPLALIEKEKEKIFLKCSNTNNEHIVLRHIKFIPHNNPQDKENNINSQISLAILPHKKRTIDITKLVEKVGKKEGTYTLEILANGQTFEGKIEVKSPLF